MEWMQNRHTEQAEEKSLIKTNLFVNTAIEKLQRESHVDIPSTFWRWENTVKQRRWHVRQNTTRRPFVRRAHTHTRTKNANENCWEREQKWTTKNIAHLSFETHIMMTHSRQITFLWSGMTACDMHISHCMNTKDSLRANKKNTACIYGYLPMAPFNWKNKTYKHFISFCSQICERRLLTKCPNDGFMEMDSQWTEPHNVGTLCHSIITNIATTTTHAREYWKRKKCSG